MKSHKILGGATALALGLSLGLYVDDLALFFGLLVTLIGVLVVAELWLFVAYELLVLRHGVYGSLISTWRYALGLWSG